MKIYIVRHGETSFNKEHKMQGVTDTPLNEYGIKLAELTGDNMKGIKFDACFSSPLDRAHQTAKIILSHSNNNTKIEFDDRLKEINLGIYEGKSFDVNNLEIPLVKLLLFRYNAFLPRRFKDGETAFEVCERTQEFLQELSQKNYENVLVSTHGLAMRAMLNKLYKHSFNFWQGRVPYNCEVNIVEVKDNKMTLIEKDKVYYDKSLIKNNYKLTRSKQ